MIHPGTLDLRAQRFAPLSYTIEVDGLDLTGATLRAQVRLYPNAPGAPLIDFAQTSVSGASGVRFAGMSEVEDRPVSVLQLVLDRDTVAATPALGEPGDDTVLAWDLHVTRPGSIKVVLLRGRFVVEGGVTQ